MKKFRIRMTRIVHDIEQCFVEVEAISKDAALEMAYDAVQEQDVNWQWKDSLPGGDDLEAHEAYEV